MAKLILTAMQKVDLSVSFVDGAGNTAQVDGAPVWASSDETVLAVTAAEDGMSATATTVGPLGSVQISVTGDAVIGEGTEVVVGTLDVDVVADKAVSANIGAGTPSPR